MVRVLIRDRTAPYLYTDDDIESFINFYSPTLSAEYAIFSAAADLLDGLTAAVAQRGFAKVKIDGELEVDTRPSSGGNSQSLASQYRARAAGVPYSSAAELGCSIPQVMEMLENQIMLTEGLDVFAWS